MSGLDIVALGEAMVEFNQTAPGARTYLQGFGGDTSNFVSFLQNTESYRRDLRRAEYGDERGPVMREFLTRISPLTNAARITKPLLVVQGRNDPRVPYTESEQIVKALRDRNAPVEYTLFEDEGHGFVKLTNRLVVYPKIVEFLERYMKP